MPARPSHEGALFEGQDNVQDSVKRLADILEDLRRHASSDMLRDELCRYVDGAVPGLRSMITAAEDTIVHLRNLRSDRMSPVQRLPPELLSLVFDYLIWTGLPYVDLIRATHVCRLWRATALDNAPLWTHLIGFADIAKAKTFIQRSQRLPLHVHLKRGLHPSLESTFCSMVRVLSERLRSLTYEAKNVMKLLAFMKSMVSVPAPHLQTLHLLVDPHEKSRIVDDRYLNGLEIFGADDDLTHLPMLRSLRLHGICIPWTSNRYANLSVLEVDTPEMRAPSQRRLLQILQQCPTLTYLRLCLAGLSAHVISQDDPAWIISLPLLSKLKLEDMPPGDIRGLLSHLSLPSTTRYSIQTSADDDAPDRILPSNRSRLPGLMACDRVEFNWIDRPILTLRVDVVPATLTTMMSLLDIASARTIVVCNLWDEDGAELEWETLFASVSDLRTLRLVYHMERAALVNALKVLAQPRDVSSDAGDVGMQRPLCVELTELELIGARCSDCMRDALLQVCRWRKDEGVPLARLELLEVNGMDPEVIRQLQELVAEVSVNEL